MKRRITLYLAGRAVDLADEGLVLLNIAQTDLTNPTIVRNSWSQSVELPRTDRNNQVFGHSFRLDRNAGIGGGAGADFNASRRIDFAIYDETGEILHSGYAKLESVTREGYTVTLFGGLGEFLYNLAYDEAGNKRSLASLDYGADLDFTINAQAVADAWARYGGDTSKPAKWDIINFAPCLNGIPEDFEADKAIGDPAVCGMPTQQTKDGTTYDAANTSGYAVFNFPDARDEWAVKDLRSYLQRPIINVEKMVAAIADPANNGGWIVDHSGVSFPGWLTRPLLPSLGTYRKQTGGVSIAAHAVGTYTTGTEVGGFDINLGSTPAGTRISARLSVTPAFAVASAVSAGQTRLTPLGYTGRGTYMQVLFLQAIGYTSGNTKVAASAVQVVYPMAGSIPLSDVVSLCGFTPDSLNTNYEQPLVEEFYDRISGTNNFKRTQPIGLSIEGTDIARVEVKMVAYLVDWGNGSASGGTYPYARLYSTDWENYYTPTGASFAAASGTATTEGADTLRSGALVTKKMLLSTKATPADYLLALCKMYGYYIVADRATRSVQIIDRGDFFNNSTPLDITSRVDKESVEIVPLSFDAKWYEFKHKSVGGRFETEYQQTEGMQYGIQRVDTGYDFDAETKDLLAGSVLKSCAAVTDRSKYWYELDESGQYRPALMLDNGNTYTLRSADGNTLDTDIPVPGGATLTPYNPNYPGCSPLVLAEFRDAENKAVDGADVLLISGYGLSPVTLLTQFNLTDDLPIMDTLVGGPCWILAGNADGIRIPYFSRYTIVEPLNRAPYVTASLDFGMPRQLDIPNLHYAQERTIYARRWADFIRDRLSVHNKVLRCRVHLDGLQVGVGLLRRFYWYGGSLWVLNKISNYSLTTFDPAECEFVQVRDIDNYTTGQY